MGEKLVSYARIDQKIDSFLFYTILQYKKEFQEFLDKEIKLELDEYMKYINKEAEFTSIDKGWTGNLIKDRDDKDLTEEHRNKIRIKMIELFIKGLIEANKNEKSSEDDKNDKLSELLDNYIKIKIKEQTTVLDYIRDWLPIIFTLIFIILIIITMFYVRRYKNEFNIKFKIKSKKKQKGGNSRSKKRKKYVDVIFYN